MQHFFILHLLLVSQLPHPGHGEKFLIKSESEGEGEPEDNSFRMQLVQWKTTTPAIRKTFEEQYFTRSHDYEDYIMIGSLEKPTSKAENESKGPWRSGRKRQPQKKDSEQSERLRKFKKKMHRSKKRKKKRRRKRKKKRKKKKLKKKVKDPKLTAYTTPLAYKTPAPYTAPSPNAQHHILHLPLTPSTAPTPPPTPCCCKREERECVGKKINGKLEKYLVECCPEKCCCHKKEGVCMGVKLEKCCVDQIRRPGKWSSMLIGSCRMGDNSSCDEDKTESPRGDNKDTA